ncbi:MAG TPA: hypothetical protein VJX67_17630 [Blastocatellia bacterium]|nr:hypothetical protein [Blastocatellia bacterium]
MKTDVPEGAAILEPGSKPSRPETAQSIAEQVYRRLGDSSIDAIYRDRILAGRTRSYDLNAAARGPRIEVEIIHTLLGIELRIGNRRLICPDLSTARYLSVFARMGCDSVAVPYDITRMSMLADELESSWQQMSLLVDHLAEGRSERLRSMVRRKLTGDLRIRIGQLGAGAKFPQFEPPRRRKR